ncbi:MAG: hypothetical protein WA747_11975 [Steroidobacteraceae bacterium]
MEERTIRLIVVLALFAFSLLRMWKKARGGNRPSSVPPPAAQLPTRNAPAPGSIPDGWIDSGGSSPLAMFAAGLVWIGGNVAMWLALFELPALADIPVNWRLAAGVIGNLFLILIARAIAARLRPRRSPQMTGGNPFPDS